MEKEKESVEKAKEKIEELMSEVEPKLKQLIVSDKSNAEAKEDVQKLEIPSKYKRMILRGLREPRYPGETAEKIFEETDFRVMCALIESDYDYETIKSIFLNEALSSFSLNMRKKGGKVLRQLFQTASEMVYMKKMGADTQEKMNIVRIKDGKGAVADKKKTIADNILNDLILKNNPVGYGFYDNNQRIPYFFDKEEKELMDVESDDFYLYIRDKYGIQKVDYDPEVCDTVRGYIKRHCDNIEPRNFTYFDKQKFILYVCNHNNEIYKLNGSKIKLVDNGTDSVYFEYKSDNIPFELDEQLKVFNYFKRGKVKEGQVFVTVKGKKVKTPIILTKGIVRYGFNWTRFFRKNCYLNEYLIARTTFCEEESKLTVNEQKLMLVLYFYSLFFENIMRDKCIPCWVGVKATGKSTIAASVGKILFGDVFECAHMPESARSFGTVVGDNYLIMLDNVDGNQISRDTANIMCTIATGRGKVQRRKLYKDREVVKFTPHVFLGITSRNPEFKKYPDLVDRILLFKTKKVEAVIDGITDSLIENRDKIMTEVLTNLNSIVMILKKLKDHKPILSTRMSSWETFIRKICPGIHEGFILRMSLKALIAARDEFELEGDYIYITLNYLLEIKNEKIIAESTKELYRRLKNAAEEVEIYDFDKQVGNVFGFGRRMRYLKEKLAMKFEVESRRISGNVKMWTISLKGRQAGEDEN